MDKSLRFYIRKIESSITSGEYSRAEAYLSEAKKIKFFENNFRLISLKDFISYYKSNSLGEVVDKRFSLSDRFIGRKAVEKEIFHAVRECQPFSLVRLGDGEGNILAYDTMRTDFPDAYFWGMRFGLDLWFGKDRNFSIYDFMDTIYDDFKSSVKSADIICIPGKDRIESVRGKSPRGYAGCAAVVDYVCDWLNNSKNRIGDCNIHYHLAKSGFFNKLLSQVESCAVVTCHMKLSSMLSEKYDGLKVTEYLIPEEKNNSKTFGVLSQELHYPDVYNILQDDLYPDFQGQVFLVAAGPLGKIYCSLIKERGGIAIDIGSIADIWAGYHSRPAHRKASLEHMKKLSLLF